MRILAVSGSLRRDSHNSQLLRAAQELAPVGVELELYDGLAAVEPFDQDDERDAPAGAQAFRDAIAAADAVLFATPEYNSSIPGQLKNALDWASRPSVREGALWSKPVAVIGASTGSFGAVWAQAELRKVLSASGARVAEAELAVGRAAEHFADGTLVDPDLRRGLAEAIETLAGSVRPALAAA
jgi:chromate reductase, NAD(P)H dehydrogenase (quinone)